MKADNYIKDMVYAASDGIVTTFAVVAGVVGAQLGEATIVIIGLASLFADGFSMASSDFLATKSEHEVMAREGNADLPEHHYPFREAAVTFVTFICSGVIPLIPYLAGYNNFLYAVIATLVALLIVGVLRAWATGSGMWSSVLLVLFVGSASSAIAYAVGAFIRSLAP